MARRKTDSRPIKNQHIARFALAMSIATSPTLLHAQQTVPSHPDNSILSRTSVCGSDAKTVLARRWLGFEKRAQSKPVVPASLPELAPGAQSLELAAPQLPAPQLLPELPLSVITVAAEQPIGQLSEIPGPARQAGTGVSISASDNATVANTDAMDLMNSLEMPSQPVPKISNAPSEGIVQAALSDVSDKSGQSVKIGGLHPVSQPRPSNMGVQSTSKQPEVVKPNQMKIQIVGGPTESQASRKPLVTMLASAPARKVGVGREDPFESTTHALNDTTNFSLNDASEHTLSEHTLSDRDETISLSDRDDYVVEATQSIEPKKTEPIRPMAIEPARVASSDRVSSKSERGIEYVSEVKIDPLTSSNIASTPMSRGELKTNADFEFSKSIINTNRRIAANVGEVTKQRSQQVIHGVSVEVEDICQLIQTGTRNFSVIGLREGTTRIALITEVDGQQQVEISQVVVTNNRLVDSDLNRLANDISQTVRELYPDCHVAIDVEGQTLVVSGTVDSEECARKILGMVRRTALRPVKDELRTY